MRTALSTAHLSQQLCLDQYNSYLFHFDPLPASVPFYISNIRFDNKVIGVQIFSNGYANLQKPLNTPYVGTLETGDVAVGGSVVYPTGVTYRGLDEDEFALVISNNDVSLMGIAIGGQIYQVRILTSVPVFTNVPEPTTFIVWGIIALACCGYAFHRRIAASSFQLVFAEGQRAATERSLNRLTSEEYV